MIRVTTFYKFAISLLLIFPLLTQGLLTFISNKSFTSIAIRFGGVSELIPFLLLLIVGILKYENNFSNLRKIFLYISIFACTYGFISLVLGSFFNYSMIYTLGDTFRYLLPFIGIFCLLLSVNNQENSMYFIIFSIKSLIIITILKIILKIYLIINGVYYGGGLNQFYIEPFLVILLIYGALNKGFVFYEFKLSRVFCIILLFSSSIFLILSLKRSFWVIFLFSLFFYAVFFKKSLKIASFMLVVIFLSVFFLQDNFFVELIISRFEYTFNTNSKIGLDKSSYERLAEIQGVMYTLSNDGYFLNYLFGMGSGAEFNADPVFPLNKSQSGTYPGYFHHIHNMYFLTIFRHGFIGLFFYLSIPVIMIWFYFKRNYSLRSTHTALVIASIIQVFTLLISGISSNSIYGYGGFSLYVSIFVFSIYLLNKGHHVR